MRRYLLIAIVAAGIKLPAQTTMTGELRSRAEYRHGYKSLIDTSSSVGLRGFYCKAKYTSDQLWIGLDVHHFTSASDVLDANLLNQQGEYAARSSALGTEIDLIVTLILTSAVSEQAGYAQMFATKTMELLKGVSCNEASNWAYMMITLKPQFFRSQSEQNCTSICAIPKSYAQC